MKHSLYVCSVCEKSFPQNKMTSGELIRPEISKEIIRICPDWNDQHFICHDDLEVMRSRYVRHLLVSDKNELTTLKHEVLNRLDDKELLSPDMESHLEQKLSLGDRLADSIASFGGSWKFLISFSIFMAFWLGANSLIYWWQPTDPYPFIFLNLILSCLSAIQAPVIMMSQNRKEAKDRIRAQHDYQINLKAELEIRILHEKIDHLLSHQWEKMMEIEKIQLELLSELRSN
ncbi:MULTISPECIES: DUF1003 domain-containing protein [Legionella]|uniref:DUF1003 domain-containing protein n=1 Tax=Legionella TaxID=445 RepID=UPI00095E4616|nr:MULTISPECIES: DUF1003 domain-containing protein [Legionella]MBN9226689.1 DUF1003 domain-containing protein [Legionella steelei]OJW06754.1 MAG: hypothetical protein BGO44_18390 [Legionella sp. 39-23]